MDSEIYNLSYKLLQKIGYYPTASIIIKNKISITTNSGQVIFFKEENGMTIIVDSEIQFFYLSKNYLKDIEKFIKETLDSIKYKKENNIKFTEEDWKFHAKWA